MKKSAMVKETISEFKQKLKRNFIIDGPSQAENNINENKRLREEKIWVTAKDLIGWYEDITEWYKKTEDNEWLMKVGGGPFF